ncbi:unnamed protein product [Triticum turgidum subsp. durum]|uniref:Uncharacterized protein n=1 Tax=Triticum turgidum subsp. durum TaxID=4567 RepID=A0A9R0TGV7_TRITD|nr:unnamed protein product [Triticum turgidum subsp. durum]
MDSARSWLQKLQKDKARPGASPLGAGMAGDDEDEPVLSSATKQKVEAAKQCIENHYKAQMRSLQERKERSYVVGVGCWRRSLLMLMYLKRSKTIS